MRAPGAEDPELHGHQLGLAGIDAGPEAPAVGPRTVPCPRCCGAGVVQVAPLVRRRRCEVCGRAFVQVYATAEGRKRGGRARRFCGARCYRVHRGRRRRAGYA